MKKNWYQFLALFIIVSITSCKKLEQVSSTPQIEYKSFAVFDTLDPLGNKSKGGRLKFSFQDGDGDLGLQAPTQNDPDSTNLFFTLYRKVSGELILAPANDPLFPSAYRIPFMERLGRDKILRGTISVTFLYLFSSPSDTIAYDFYIEDRALNQSNVASTGEIALGENKIYK